MNWYRSILFLVITVAATSLLKARERADNQAAEQVPATFFTNGEYECIVRTPPSQRAIFPPNRQLCVLYHGELECTVRRLSDLRPFVLIDTDKKALDFVRLLTREETSDAGLDEWLGADVDQNGALSSASGTIPANVLKQIRWRGANVMQNDKGWIVQRTVLLRGGPFETLRLATVTEIVSRTGDYQRKELEERWRGNLPGVAFALRL